MIDRRDVTVRLSQLVMTVEEYERLMTEALPHLLNHATTQTRRFLRETGQWADDVCHEKLALRWGYELVERFLMYGRTEIPCRPLFFLDSLIAKYFSQPEPFCYDKELLSPLGRFLRRPDIARGHQPRRLDGAVLSSLWIRAKPGGEGLRARYDG